MSKANMLVGVQFVMFTVFAILLIVMPPVDSQAIRIAGLLLAIVGVLIGLMGIREHGTANKTSPNVTPIPKADVPLVTSGVYSKIRHPIYTGVIGSALGLAIAHGGIIPIVFALVFIPFFTYKSRYEETLLKQQYPEYVEYMTTTGRFLPPLM